MNIYSIVDHKNIDKIITLFYSVYLNSDERRDNLNFYLITDKIVIDVINIPKELIDKIKIRVLEFNKEWRSLLDDFNKYFYKGSNWCKNDMNFGRFLFFEVFPEVERVIYLDWDMILLGNIFELKDEYDSYKMVVSECGIQNILFTNILKKKFQLNFCKSVSYQTSPTIKIFNYLKLSINVLKKVDSFNSGFYIVSKQQFSTDYLQDLITKLIKVQKRYSCFNFGTQVIMNLMHLKKRTYVSKYWNYMPHNDVTENIKIIHWNGKFKPWNTDIHLKKVWLEYNDKVNNSEIIKLTKLVEDSDSKIQQEYPSHQ